MCVHTDVHTAAVRWQVYSTLRDDDGIRARYLGGVGVFTRTCVARVRDTTAEKRRRAEERTSGDDGPLGTARGARALGRRAPGAGA